jgi:hypothetical protein
MRTMEASDASDTRVDSGQLGPGGPVRGRFAARPEGRGRPSPERVAHLGSVDNEDEPPRTEVVSPIGREPTGRATRGMGQSERRASSPALADGRAARATLGCRLGPGATPSRTGRVQRPASNRGTSASEEGPRPNAAQPDHERLGEGSRRWEVAHDPGPAGGLRGPRRSICEPWAGGETLLAPRAKSGPRPEGRGAKGRTRDSGLGARPSPLVRWYRLPSRCFACGPEVPLWARVGGHDGSLHRPGHVGGREGPLAVRPEDGVRYGPGRGPNPAHARGQPQSGRTSDVCRHSSVGRAADL